MNRSNHVLLVDDNEMDVELPMHAFRESKCSGTVHVARGGQEALDYIFGNAPYEDRARHPMPSIVLLDLKMPGVDGFEVLRQMKQNDCVRRVPVVILTSSPDERDRAATYDIGANSYLVKPTSFEDLVAIVRKVEEYWLRLNAEPPLT